MKNLHRFWNSEHGWLLKGAWLGLITCLTVVGGIGAYSLGRALTTSPIFGGNPSKISSANQPVAIDSEGNPISPPINIVPESVTPWDGTGRVTILLVGLDFRDWEAGEKYSRSDTMILLTLDPLTKKAGILSIPRDLWTAIPGFQHGKINTAYYLGAAYQLPGGGPGLAIDTVEQLLGVPINYFAQVDFEAFVRLIDEIGGVKLNIPQTITIDLLGGEGAKTKKQLKPGIQVLPGEWALAYARARNTEGGDFDRARRQQQVIFAIRDRLLSKEMFSTLIRKAPTLYQQLAAGIQTNLSLDEAIKLAFLAVEIPEESIKRAVIGEEQTIFGWSPDKLSILIPLPDRIELIRDQVFSGDGSLAPATLGGTREQMQAEAALIKVLNGSSNPDLAFRLAEYLKVNNAQVIETGEAEQYYAGTTLIDHTGNPYILKFMVEVFGIPSARIYHKPDPGSSVDVTIIAGEEMAVGGIPTP